MLKALIDQLAMRKKSRPTKDSADELIVGELSIRVLRSQRRSLALQVKPSGIVMRAPWFCQNQELLQFANSKYAWLVEQNNKLQQQLNAAEKHFCDGEIFQCFAQDFQLNIVSGNQSSIHFTPRYQTIEQDSEQDAGQNETPAIDTLTITVSQRVKHQTAYVRRQLYAWYQQQARDYLQQRIPEIAADMGMSHPADYRSIKVRDYKARWGSCSSKGDLSFNWRIIMAPKAAIDSVIVHELAHTQHFNHSKVFWQLVYQTQPEYREHHQWFDQHRLALMF